MTKKVWAYWPERRRKGAPKVPDFVKAEVKSRADELIKTVLKPEHIKPPPEDNDFNYLVDIFGKWYRRYFYFCSKYNCPGPNALSHSFEDKFARLEYIGPGRFNMAYMRHTGMWQELYSALTLDESLKAIAEDPFLIRSYPLLKWLRKIRI